MYLSQCHKLMMELTPEQQQAFNAVVKGGSVCISGSAGSGKSVCLSSIIKWAHSNNKEVGVTSTTGSSAILIQGRTLHSFLGIGLAKKSAEALAIDVIKKKKQIVLKIRNLNILIIDEISMLDDELFTKISEFLSILRKNNRPFGGIQMIFCGDFAQIPPVHGDLCFKSQVWKDMKIEKFVFSKLIRQQHDLDFQKILEALRWGNCTPEILKILKSTKNNKFPDGIVPTIMYSRNIDVDAINKKKYEELIATGVPRRQYKTKYSDAIVSKAWGESCKIPEMVELCVGCQVMCTYNVDVDMGISNGSRGVIIELCASGPRVKFVSGVEIIIEPYKTEMEDMEGIHISFVPLKLAWAITVHKSQGCTLDAVVCDLGSSIFEYGMGYTAITRAKTLSSIRITDVIASSFRTHPDVKKFYGKS